MKIKTNFIFIVLWIVFAGVTDTIAQEAIPRALDIEAIKQANNPLAPTKAFNVHNYTIFNIYGVEDMAMNNFMLRYAQPIGPIFLRATMPFVTESLPSEAPTTGFGDFSIFGIYKFPIHSEGISVGVGPLLVAPTGSHGLGQGKWQTGLSAMAFFSKSHVIQMGTLLQWQFSFAGDDDRDDVSLLTPQMFFFWQVGGGTYLRSTGVWSFDLRTGNYNVPIGLGLGKVMNANCIVFNIFIEPQFSVLAEGAGQPRFQTFIGFNTQF